MPTTDTTAAREPQATFELGVDRSLPDFRPVVGRTVRLPDQMLRTTYFDTSELRLWSRGITLRYTRDEESGTGAWVARLPGHDGRASPDRLERSWPGDRDVIPPDALQILRGIVRRAPLVEMADLSKRRGRLVFQDPQQDQPWGGIDDDVVTVDSGPRRGLRFRHVQVRFDGGDRQLVDAVLAQLTDQGAQDGAQPDVAVALGFPPVSHDPSGSALDARASFGELVTVTLAEGLSRLLDRDYQLRLESETPDPEAIHQARVATRRLRSNLKTFGSGLDPIWVAHRRADLRWLGEALGRVRDPHVLADRLTARAEDEPEDAAQRAELIQKLRHDARLAAADLTQVLADHQYLDLLDHLHAAAVLPPFYSGPAAHDPAVVVAPPLVAAQWRAVRRRVRKAGRHPSDRQLHEIRRRAKQLRYAAEAVAPVIGRPAGRMARQAKRLQTILGDHHDAVVAEAWLRDQARGGESTPAAAFQAGLLCLEERRQQQQLRRRWRRAYRQLSRPRGAGLARVVGTR